MDAESLWFNKTIKCKFLKFLLIINCIVYIVFFIIFSPLKITHQLLRAHRVGASGVGTQLLELASLDAQDQREGQIGTTEHNDHNVVVIGVKIVVVLTRNQIIR